MKWFKDPPCIPMKVSLHDASAGRLELDESGLGRLWNAGLFTAVGTFMAGVGLKMARWAPGMSKLVPLAVATAGGTAATLGVMSGLSHHNISFERDRGVHLRWRFGRGRPRELRIPLDQIAAFEVVHRKRTDKQNDIEVEVDFYHLMLVDTAGKAIALEEFGTRTQAKLRQQMIEQVLGRREPAVDAKVEAGRAPEPAAARSTSPGKAEPPKRSAPVKKSPPAEKSAAPRKAAARRRATSKR